MSYEAKRAYLSEPKYIPSQRDRQEYPPPKTDVSSLSAVELSQMKAKLDRPLVFDEKVLKSLLPEQSKSE